MVYWLEYVERGMNLVRGTYFYHCTGQISVFLSLFYRMYPKMELNFERDNIRLNILLKKSENMLLYIANNLFCYFSKMIYLCLPGPSQDIRKEGNTARNISTFLITVICKKNIFFFLNKKNMGEGRCFTWMDFYRIC